MKCTTNRPTTSGFFWYRASGYNNPIVVEVEWDVVTESAEVYLPGNAHSHHLASMIGEWAPVADMPDELPPFEKWMAQHPRWHKATKREIFKAGQEAGR